MNMEDWEDYDRFMDEHGHEDCAQMLLRNSARERRDLLDEIAWLNAELHGAEMEAEKLRKVIVLMNILFDEEKERLCSYSLLIDLLRDEWGIEACWDGLRRFWHIGLTEGEVRVREALEAENVRLRSCLEDAAENERLTTHEFNQLKEERDKLRELAEVAWKSAERLCQAFDGPCRADDVTIYKPCPMGERDEECIYGQLQGELRECGVEVDG